MSLPIRRSATAANAKAKRIVVPPQVEGKAKGKGGRYFDSHTISIYAHNMVQRGGSPEAAVNMIMNRMDQGKVPSSPVLYNSALHICGQKAMMGWAGKVLQKMVARNVSTNERTISSLLNAIANSFNKGTLIVDSSAIKGEAGDTPTAVKSLNKESLNPDEFKVENAKDGVKLAVKLYASWTEHCMSVEKRSKLPVQPFNALLKVLYKCGVEGGKVLDDIFPLPSPTSAKPEWVPADLDIITFTTAILICQNVLNSFQMASKYWETYLEGAKEDPSLIDSHFITAMMLVLRNDLRSKHRDGVVQMAKEEILQRRAIVDKALSLSSAITPSSTLLNSLLMENCLLLGVFERALLFWRDHIKDTSLYDHHTVTNFLLIMRKQKLYSEALAEWSRIRGKSSSVKITMNVNLLNALLVLYRLAGRHQEGLKLIDQHIKTGKVCPSVDTAYYSILLAAENDEYLPSLVKYFRGMDIWPALSQKKYIQSLLRRKQAL